MLSGLANGLYDIVICILMSLEAKPVILVLFSPAIADL